MSSMAVLRDVGDSQGWNDNTCVELLTDFIDALGGRTLDQFQRFLEGAVGEDEEEGELMSNHEAEQFLRYLLACSHHAAVFDLPAHVPRIQRILGVDETVPRVCGDKTCRGWIVGHSDALPSPHITVCDDCWTQGNSVDPVDLAIAALPELEGRERQDVLIALTNQSVYLASPIEGGALTFCCGEYRIDKSAFCPHCGENMVPNQLPRNPNV